MTEPAPKPPPATLDALSAEAGHWADEIARVCRGKLKIVTRDNRVIPFEPNVQQVMVLYWAGLQICAGFPVRLQVLKGRRFGISTMATGLGYLLTRAEPNFPALAIAHDQQGTNTLRAMSETFHSYYPVAERLPTKYFNRGEIEYKHPHGSSYHFRTAGGSAGRKGGARSAEVSYLHVSEEAWIDSADELFTGLLATVAEKEGSFIIEESTANGAVGEFYERWGRALFYKNVTKIADLNTRIGLFFSWLDFPEYRRPLGKGAEIGLLEAAELELRRLGADDEQLNWRRHIIAEWYSGNEDRFNQEFPSTPEEAFISSGRPAIPAAIIARHAATVRRPERIVRLALLDEERVEVSDSQRAANSWQVFESPVAGHAYAMGVDVAKGLLSDPANPKSETDAHAAWVLDRTRKRFVALWHGHWDVDLFGKAVLAGGHWYGQAWIAVDLTGGYGLAVLSECRGYGHLYMRPVAQDRVLEFEELAKYGVTISTGNRDMFIDQYIAACRADPATGWDGRLLVPAGVLVEEERTFEVTGKGKREHRRGKHDDVLWAAMLAVEADLRCPVSTVEMPETRTAKELLETMGIAALARPGALDPWDGAEEQEDTWNP